MPGGPAVDTDSLSDILMPEIWAGLRSLKQRLAAKKGVFLGYLICADVLVFFHLAFVAFVVAGGFFGPKVALDHVPAYTCCCMGRTG
ncbi:MAG: hypothetical protein ACP5SG_00320 [Dissulfurimicrobium sp.]|uniref:hypothetical protein n=1 Tax=Dissulfurimicrobium TaxID=1769732 RepID=UPI003C74B4E1